VAPSAEAELQAMPADNAQAVADASIEEPGLQFGELPEEEAKNQAPYFAVKAAPQSDQASAPVPVNKSAYIGSRSHTGKTIGVVLMAIGGLFGVIGAFLPWMTISAALVEVPPKLSAFDVLPAEAISRSITGVSGHWQGWLIVLNGGLLALAAIAYLVSGARASGDTGQVRTGLVPALLMSAFTAWSYLLFSSEMNEAKALMTDISTAMPDRVVAQPAFADFAQALADAIKVAWGTGFIVAVLGCALAVAGGVAVLLQSGPQVTAIAPGGTKWKRR